MTNESQRRQRIIEILEQNKEELNLIEEFMACPFSRGSVHNKLMNSPVFQTDQYKSARLYILIMGGLFLLIFGLMESNTRSTISIIFFLSIAASIIAFCSDSLTKYILCNRRRKEIMKNIQWNKAKLSNLS